MMHFANVYNVNGHSFGKVRFSRINLNLNFIKCRRMTLYHSIILTGIAVDAIIAPYPKINDAKMTGRPKGNMIAM